ncbi:histidine phosphatase family protein [Streptomyces angustmyceticus]|uniref:Phosphatase n=1 Tax=Streptomyces angustmyceticus TaxID=285578 RepID=A0A5J4LGK6_9ACTN|nr:histidine phosphatase family protein [Streptomyces angustmyceticus]UAL69353.1 histidine phosphatase family protein [Streptomyces angustmyceticus]GES29355.1 phosphatase [Streptomyces angustmyceticus]
MSDLLLVRHGETEWSRDGRHTSWTDLPLTADGEEQARALRPLLSDRKIGQVYASPMRRALRTAELAGLARPETDPDLREWDYGGYEGITTAEIHRSRPGWYLFSDGVAEGPDGHPGESPEQVGARADRVLARLTPRLAADEGDVALVGHAHFLRVLAARRLGLPPGAGGLFTFETGAVGVLGTEHDRPAVVAWNARSL